MASYSKSRESFSLVGGANPPSSPTLVASMPYFFLMIFYRQWYTSAPPYKAVRKEENPVGRIMNSCMANKLPACDLFLLKLPSVDNVQTGHWGNEF